MKRFLIPLLVVLVFACFSPSMHADNPANLPAPGNKAEPPKSEPPKEEAKLDSGDRPPLIHTVRGVGYRLAQP